MQQKPVTTRQPDILHCQFGEHFLLVKGCTKGLMPQPEQCQAIIMKMLDGSNAACHVTPAVWIGLGDFSS
jgi:hypothetical protein